MALCRTCRTAIPCHCHLTPPTQIRPGVYLTDNRWSKTRPGQPITTSQARQDGDDA